MKLRKINAVLSLVTTVLLLGHSISLAFWMLSKGNIPKASSFLPHALVVLALAHALISIDLVISGHFENENHVKSKHYPKLNVPMMVQRISGILLLLFSALHITGAMGLMQPPKAVHAIVPPLFFLISMAHVSVSFSKAFITLGIGSAKFVKKADIVIKVICGITLIADVIGFYLHVC